MLQLTKVSKQFAVESKVLRKEIGRVCAVKDVSFAVNAAEVVGLVGESGSGKTTIAKLITGLYRPDQGNITYDSVPLENLSARDKALRIQMIFQDPFASLNPRLSIGTILREALRIRFSGGREIKMEANRLLGLVGLPGDILDNYPHQFSGGQRQRIAIARALAYEPRLIIADEPLSCLDVSTQAQIINLFLELKNRMELAYLFISHDLMLVSYLCDRILVMKDGEIIERGEASAIMRHPRDNYTKRLVASAMITANNEY